MAFYYDTHSQYPFIFISNTDEGEIKELVRALKKESIIVNRFFEDPEFPASDGKKYDYMLRIGFKDEKKRIKHDSEQVERILKEFIIPSPDRGSQNGIASQAPVRIDYLEKDRIYFEQIKIFLDSERKRFEIDREFFTEQMESLNKAISTLNQEKDKIKKVLDDHDSKVTEEIRKIINNATFNNEEIKVLENRLKEKENLLKEREGELARKEQELEDTIEGYDNYKEKLDQEYKELARQLREVSLGIDVEKEESIRDIRILIFGESALTSDVIYQIFKKEFYETCGEQLEKKNIHSRYLSYDQVKKQDFSKMIKKDTYDYIIVGPIGHSNKGKSINQNYTNFVKAKNLKAKVYEDYNSKLGKEKIGTWAREIINDWAEKHELVTQ